MLNRATGATIAPETAILLHYNVDSAMINHSSNIEHDFRLFIQHWIQLLADNQIEVANQALDYHEEDDTYWTAQKVIATIHEIYSPSTRYYIQNSGRTTITSFTNNAAPIQIYAHQDGSGYSADCDVFLNHERSDIVIQFDFKNTPNGYLARVRDVHVL